MTTFARPGQAQPKQQSQGSPYNPQGGSGFQAWNPQNFQKAMQGGGNTYSAGMNDSQRTQAQTAWAQPKQQLLDWGAQAPRPEPMQAMPAMNQFGQLPNQNLNSIMQQRQALVQQINNAQSQQQVGTWLGQGAPPDNWGQMQFNPQQMWQNANQMVNQGWQNPLSQPGQARPSQQPSFGTPYNPQAPTPGSGPAEMVQWYNKNTGAAAETPAGAAAPTGSGWVERNTQPRTPNYGAAANGGSVFAIWEDSDGDGVDDKYQEGPGMPKFVYDPARQMLVPPPRGGNPRSQPQQRTPPSPAQPSPSAPGQYDDLFKQFGFSPPPGFMDALIQRLGGQQGPSSGNRNARLVTRILPAPVPKDPADSQTPQGGQSPTLPQPGGPQNTMPGFPDPGGQPQPSRPQRPQTVRERVEAEKQAYKERMQQEANMRAQAQAQPGPMPGWPQWPQLPNVGGYPPPTPPPNRNAPRPIG